jgi:DNA-binding IclR family transcriptional regulator
MGRDGLSVIEKAAVILRRFVEERSSALTYKEIVADTGLSKATTHRLLADLHANGFLVQDTQRAVYRLGPLLLTIANLAQQLTAVSERALPRMERLRDQFRETMVLAELHGGSVVPVRRVDGLYEMRMNQEIGRGYPAYAGGTGKMLLASLPADELTAFLANVSLTALTDTTVTSVEDLRLQLDRIRRAGIAISRGERVPEAVAVSAPIFDGSGAVLCALTLSGVASRFDRGRLLLAAQAVKAAAEAISVEFGYVPAPGEPRAEQLLDPTSEAYALLTEMCDAAAAAELAG